jgi:alpha-1,6-mannosyltransferase
MSGVLFGAVGHVWPWFLIWVLPLAALVPWAPLSRWVLGICLAGPIPVLLYSVVYLGNDVRWRFGLPALVLYAFATAWLIIVPRRWFDARPARLEVAVPATP